MENKQKYKRTKFSTSWEENTGKPEAFTFILRDIFLSKCSHLIASSHKITKQKQAAGKLLSWPSRCLFQHLWRNNVSGTPNKVVFLELDACQWWWQCMSWVYHKNLLKYIVLSSSALIIRLAICWLNWVLLLCIM